jgi:hypothetical protein
MTESGQSKRMIAGWHDFVEAVSAMRSAQKEYFKTQSSPALFRAKELEQLVDRAIAEHLERKKLREAKP